MRHSQSEKLEIIRVVEDSSLGVKRTLQELDINRSTFYAWYERYLNRGAEALVDRTSHRRQFWNAIPPWVKKKVVETALEHLDKSPRELACHLTDTQKYFISESSVYRILKVNGLITSPAYTVLSAKDKFDQPTTRINQLWQTDFTYLKIVHWGWYYLSTVMDDYSRYILSWRLCSGMSAEDVKATIDDAIAVSGVDHVYVNHRPRLLSDNGPCYISGELKKYLADQGFTHTRGKPYHPMTQGKIERYHRSMKNILLLDNYYCPDDLTAEIGKFVEYYNHRRYHESLENVTPADAYTGRAAAILEQREKTKRETINRRRIEYRKAIAMRQTVS
jgi:transposase InsO family protein/transposase-like protein